MFPAPIRMRVTPLSDKPDAIGLGRDLGIGVKGALVLANEETMNLTNNMEAVAVAANSFATGLSHGFGNLLIVSDSFGDSLKNLGNILNRVVAQFAAAVVQALILKTILSLIPGVGQFSLFAGITPFAHGGIVTKPTIGLLGERGPEAVIPLSQMSSMQGGGVLTTSIGLNALHFALDRNAKRNHFGGIG